MEREYIRIKKPETPFPIGIHQLRKLDDEFWKKWVFYYLLDFYKNYNSDELKSKIIEEQQKPHSRIEREIAKFIRLKLKTNRQFGLNFSVKGEETNDEDVEGNYDIIIHNTYWKNKDFYFECKNLDDKQNLVNKYVCYNQGHSKFDGGVYRYFNGKYAQNLEFGGMIGFLLKGDLTEVKDKIKKKLSHKFDITPEGDLIDITDNSIEGNSFTFDSCHTRFNKEFLIHHLLFDFT